MVTACAQIRRRGTTRAYLSLLFIAGYCLPSVTPSTHGYGFTARYTYITPTTRSTIFIKHGDDLIPTHQWSSNFFGFVNIRENNIGLLGQNQQQAGFLTETAAAILVVDRNVFFEDIPHVRSLNQHQQQRTSNSLQPLLLGSLRINSPYYRP